MAGGSGRRKAKRAKVRLYGPVGFLAMRVGAIIAYRERGRLVLGMVQKASSSRGASLSSGEIEILNEEGKKVTFAAEKVSLVFAESLFSTLAPAELKKQLRELHAGISARAEGVDLRELWELLSQEEAEAFFWEEIAQLLLSSPEDPLARAAVLEALLNDSVYFREKKTSFFAPKDTQSVQETLRQGEIERSRSAARARFVAWVKERLSSSRAAPLVSDPEIERHLDQLKGLALYREGYEKKEQAEGLLEELAFAGRGQLWDVAFQLLVALGVWKEDEELSVLRYKISTSFSAEGLKEAEEILEFTPGQEGYSDFTGLLTFTIDDPETTEVDDALSLSEEGGQLSVGIHIADASYFVRPGGVVDRGALNRGTTVYLPRGKLAMIPPGLGEDKASLLVGKIRPTLSFFATFDRQGNLIAERICRGFIRVARRFSYQEAEALLGEEKTDEWGVYLRHLARIALARRELRVRQGAVIIDADEVKVKVSADGEIKVGVLAGNSPSRSLVSEFMVLANEIAARYCYAHSFPALYIGQEPPDGPIPSLESFPTGRVYVHAVRRLMKRAQIRLNPERHSGLGVFLYTQISSPLRRYHDLQMHHQIKHHLEHGQPLFDAERLQMIAAGAEQSGAEATLCERESTRYWLLRYLEDKKGQRLKGQVVREQGGRYTIELDETLLTVTLSPTRSLSLGSAVGVVLERVNARRDILNVRLV
jgi:exoribonuclease-2